MGLVVKVDLTAITWSTREGDTYPKFESCLTSGSSALLKCTVTLVQHKLLIMTVALPRSLIASMATDFVEYGVSCPFRMVFGGARALGTCTVDSSLSATLFAGGISVLW